MGKQVWVLIVLFVLVMVSAFGAAIPSSAATPAPPPLPPPTLISTTVRPADGAVTFLLPPMGVFWGAVILGERIG
jgi:hypothetical protein